MTARKAAPRKAGAAATRARAGAGAAAASRIPANAPQPQDRKRGKTAAEKRAEAAVRAAEANDGYLDVVSCGVPLRVPVGGKVPLAAYMEFEKGNELAGTEILLGPDQWKAFMAANPTIDDFAEIGAQLEAIAGN